MVGQSKNMKHVKSKCLYLCLNVVSSRHLECLFKLPITNTIRLCRKNDKKFCISIKTMIINENFAVYESIWNVANRCFKSRFHQNSTRGASDQIDGDMQKCISDIFRESELKTGIGAHTCRLSANIDKEERWFIIFFQRQAAIVLSP